MASAVSCFIQVLSLSQRAQFEQFQEQVSHRVYFRPTQDVQAQDRLTPTTSPLGTRTLSVQAVSTTDKYRIAAAKEIV